jgi:hypothetical protein
MQRARKQNDVNFTDNAGVRARARATARARARAS